MYGNQETSRIVWNTIAASYEGSNSFLTARGTADRAGLREVVMRLGSRLRQRGLRGAGLWLLLIASAGINGPAGAQQPAPAATIGAPILVAGTTLLRSIACPTADLCYALGHEGNAGRGPTVFVAVRDGVPDPATLMEDISGERAMACPSSDVCYVVGYQNTAATPPAPPDLGSLVTITGGSEAGEQTVADTFGLNDIACPTSDICFAVGVQNPRDPVGVVVPIMDGQAGAEITVGGTHDLSGIACPADNLCYAVGSVEPAPTVGLSAAVLVSVQDGVVGSPQIVSGASTAGQGSVLFSIACPSVDACYAVGSGPAASGRGSEGIVVPLIDGVAGDPVILPDVSLPDRVSCASISQCYALELQQNTVQPIENGYPAAVETTGGPYKLFDIACPTAGTCYGVGWHTTDGFTSDGGVIVPLTNADAGASP